MQLNYTAFALISVIPLVIAIVWYHPRSLFVKWSGIANIRNPLSLNPLYFIGAYALSFILVFGYINLVIHQVGFYELFFTDIMNGSEEAKRVTSEFLASYGQKHRHFMHGIFHGTIISFAFPLPYLAFHTVLDNKPFRYLMLHFGFWLVATVIVGGLIAEFV